MFCSKANISRLLDVFFFLFYSRAVILWRRNRSDFSNSLRGKVWIVLCQIKSCWAASQHLAANEIQIAVWGWCRDLCTSSATTEGGEATHVFFSQVSAGLKAAGWKKKAFILMGCCFGVSSKETTTPADRNCTKYSSRDVNSQFLSHVVSLKVALLHSTNLSFSPSPSPTDLLHLFSNYIPLLDQYWQLLCLASWPLFLFHSLFFSLSLR